MRVSLVLTWLGSVRTVPQPIRNYSADLSIGRRPTCSDCAQPPISTVGTCRNSLGRADGR